MGNNLEKGFTVLRGERNYTRGNRYGIPFREYKPTGRMGNDYVPHNCERIPIEGTGNVHTTARTQKTYIAKSAPTPSIVRAVVLECGGSIAVSDLVTVLKKGSLLNDATIKRVLRDAERARTIEIIDGVVEAFNEDEQL